MANFRHEFVKTAGTRLVPAHSLAFRPEWYPRVRPPDASPLPAVESDAAPRGHPPSGALQHAVPCGTAPGGLPHQTHTLREDPTLRRACSSGRIGTRTAARVRPPCGRTCLRRPPLRTLLPSPRSPSAGMKVVQAAAQQVHTEGGSYAPHGPTPFHRVSGVPARRLAQTRQ